MIDQTVLANSIKTMIPNNHGVYRIYTRVNTVNMAKREYSMKIYFVENEQIKELMQGTVKMVDYLHSMHGQPHAFIKETFDKVFDPHERPFVCLSHNEI